jgi:sugar (pentulose or hexulose) kinase
MGLGALTKATLQGMVNELLSMYQDHIGPHTHHAYLVASGGAARKTPALPGLLEDGFGLPVRLAQDPEPGALGAAMLAAQMAEKA